MVGTWVTCGALPMVAMVASMSRVLNSASICASNLAPSPWGLEAIKFSSCHAANCNIGTLCLCTSRLLGEARRISEQHRQAAKATRQGGLTRVLWLIASKDYLLLGRASLSAFTLRRLHSRT